MPIQSSAIADFARQHDDRVWVREAQIDQFGADRGVAYLADAGITRVTALATALARVAQINAGIIAAEISANLASVLSMGSLATVTIMDSNVAANVAVLRAAYAVATQVQAIMIGDYLSTLTNVQLQNAFGMTAGQVTTLRTNKLTPAATAAATIRAAVGA